MNRTKALTTNVFILSFLLLLGLSNQMNGQKKEARKLFPIDDNTAFIDITGRVVIRASQTELNNAVDRISSKLGRFNGPAPESWITFDEFSEGFAVTHWTLCPKCHSPDRADGFIDESGRLVIPPQNFLTQYGSFHEGLAKYSDKGWGFINREGQIVIPAKFYDAFEPRMLRCQS